MGKRVIFKSYIGKTVRGEPVLHDTSAFGNAHFVEMFQQSVSLIRVNFQTAHRIWGDHVSHLFRDKADTKDLVMFMNRGFVKALADLGYRCVPDPEEIEVLD